MTRAWLGLALLLLPVPLVAAGPTAIEQCIQRQRPAIKQATNDFETLGRLHNVCHGILSNEQSVRQQAATNRIYENQIFDSHVLLFTVVFITLSGIVLAALQLWASYKLAVKSGGTLGDAGEVSLQPGNVAVKSSVVGVIILGISLAFFAIFVTQVYRIQNITIGAEEGTSASSPGAEPAVEAEAVPVTPALPVTAAPAAAPPR